MRDVPIANVVASVAVLPAGLALSFLWMLYLKAAEIDATCPCWNKQAVEQAYVYAVAYTAVLGGIGVLLAVRHGMNVRARRGAG